MHLCLFDIDGTLLLTGGAGQRAFAATFLHDFGVQQFDGSVLFAGRSDRAILADLFVAHGLLATEDAFRTFREGYLHRLNDELERQQGRVLPGIVSLLQRLADRGDTAIGIVTGNMRDGAHRKLQHYELEHFFPFGGFGDDHYDRSDIAREAQQRGLQWMSQRRITPDPKHRVVVVGDTPHDITSARAIGAIAVAVATGSFSTTDLAAAEPDLLLESLVESESFCDLLAN